MTRTQIYLPERQKRLLKIIAFDEETTFSNIVRELLENGLRLKMRKKQKSRRKMSAGEFLFNMALKAKKYGFSGPHDLSINHDKYLYGMKN